MGSLWEALRMNAVPILTLDVAMTIAFGILVLYRLDRIPRLWIPGTVAILLWARALDTITFLGLTGGNYVLGEVNPFYHVLAPHLLGGAGAMIAIQLVVTVLALIGFWLLWIGRFPLRLWLAFVGIYSVASLIGAATNVLTLFDIWIL